MPLHCACGSENSINHSLSCKTGGYTIFRHNMVRDTIADILKETCKDVKIEPELIPIDSDYTNMTGNTAEKARLDVSSVGLWSPMERNFMDIRVFHPNAPSYQKKSLKSLYEANERQKKSAYNSRVIQVEKSTFTQGWGKSVAEPSKELLLTSQTKGKKDKQMSWGTCLLK